MPTTIADFQPVITAALASSEIVSPTVVDPSDFREVVINPLVPQDHLPLMDMSMFLDVGLMDGKDSVPQGDVFPDPLDVCDSATPPPPAFPVMSDDMECLKGFVAGCNEQQTVVTPPSRMPWRLSPPVLPRFR